MILVTGANGQVGRAIIKALLSKGEQIRSFVPCLLFYLIHLRGRPPESPRSGF